MNTHDRGVLAVVQQADQVFRSITRAFASACPSAADADHHQGALFELASASAELEAARQVLAGDGFTSLQKDLATAFAVEAVTAVLSRMHQIAIDLEVDTAPVLALSGSAELGVLRSACTSSMAMARLGAAVVEDTAALVLPVADEGVAMARDAFERFAHQVVAPMAQDLHRQDLTIPEQVLQPLREMGAFGLSVPQEFGGSASGGIQDNALMIAVTEALSEASLAGAGSLITRPEILARALLAGGTPEQESKWLPRIASGELLCGIAITEPDHGSDVAGLRLTATRVENGWRLKGAKSWCTFAGKANLLMVVARTDTARDARHRGLSVFLVEKPSTEAHAFDCSSAGGGQLSGRAIATIGYRGMHSFDLAFDDFFVADDRLIGGSAGLGRGFYFTMAGMVGGRLQTAGRACGVMRAAIKAAIVYARDREVFGAPLASFQLTQIKIGRMAARYLACRQLAEATGRATERSTHAMEASQAKLLACRSAEWVTREAQQLHGAMGYAEETAVSRYFVDARVLSIFEGAEETLALKVIGRTLLEAAGTAEGSA